MNSFFLRRILDMFDFVFFSVFFNDYWDIKLIELMYLLG